MEQTLELINLHCDESNNFPIDRCRLGCGNDEEDQDVCGGDHSPHVEGDEELAHCQVDVTLASCGSTYLVIRPTRTLANPQAMV